MKSVNAARPLFGEGMVLVTALAYPLTLLALLGLASGLERLHRRPFLASLWGHLFARALGGERVRGAPFTLYQVAALPAVGFRAAGQTWGEVVLVVRGRASPALLAHEACHVAQYRRLTSTGFWLLYLWGWLGGLHKYRTLYAAYRQIPLEAEAREAAYRMVERARPWSTDEASSSKAGAAPKGEARWTKA